jgi:hypothetical protein
MTSEDSSIRAIRQAVASGKYQRASLLWTDYVDRMKEELRGGSFSAERLAEVRGLVEWSRRVVLCARAHARDRLRRLQVAVEYEAPSSPRAPGIRQRSF